MKMDGSFKTLLILLAIYFLVSTVFRLLPNAPGFMVAVLAGVIIFGFAVPNRRDRR